MAELESEYRGEGARETASIPDNQLEVKPENPMTDKDIDKIAEEVTKSETEKAEKPEAAKGEVASAEQGETHEKTAEKEHVAAEHQEATETEHGAGHHESAEPAHHKADEPKQAESAHAKTPEGFDKKIEEVAEKVAHGHAPTEPPKEEAKPRLPSSLPAGIAASSIGKYTVQISSHQSDEEAQTQAKELQSKGYSAFVVPAVVKGKKWFRVSIGLYESKDEAKVSREKLLKGGHITAAIVQQIVQ